MVAVGRGSHARGCCSFDPLPAAGSAIVHGDARRGESVRTAKPFRAQAMTSTSAIPDAARIYERPETRELHARRGATSGDIDSFRAASPGVLIGPIGSVHNGIVPVCGERLGTSAKAASRLRRCRTAHRAAPRAKVSMSGCKAIVGVRMAIAREALHATSAGQISAIAAPRRGMKDAPTQRRPPIWRFDSKGGETAVSSS